MYESFFNLTGKPFDLLPNPDFLYLSKSHKKALIYLDYAIRERAGFILLTGEIGSGKTTIIRSLINKHHDSVVLARVFNTRVNSEQLLAMINDDFGISTNSTEKTALLRDLNEFLIDQYARGNKPVLIIDEAQNLSQKTLEDVRMLSNLETDDAKLLQIILVGQPELRQTLSAPGLVQLRQRISVNCHIQPLSKDEVGDYILHRLEVAGNREAIHFSPSSIELIWQYSRGIPRLINIICDFLLLSAFADDTREISVEFTQEIIGDLDFDNQFWGNDSVCGSEGGEARVSGTPQKNQSVARQNDIKDLLTEILQRIESLEKKHASQQSQEPEGVGQRLQKYDEIFNEYFRTTSLEIKELKNMLQANTSSAESPLSSPEVEGERKKGFFGKLFRAA